MTTSPISNSNAAAQAAGATGTSGTSGNSSTGTLAFTQNFNTFLTLLTTQLQNQDPTSPMDTDEFTNQLVEFSQVEQQINTNSNLQQLIGLQSAGETISALPVVGQSVEYNSPTAPLADGAANYAYTMPSTAASANIVITNSAGNVVFTDKANTAAGTYNYAWNGKTSAGVQEPDGGTYTMAIQASSANGTAITPTINSVGTVNGVSINNGQASFNIAGMSVPMSELVTINPSASTSTANAN